MIERIIKAMQSDYRIWIIFIGPYLLLGLLAMIGAALVDTMRGIYSIVKNNCLSFLHEFDRVFIKTKPFSKKEFNRRFEK